MVSDIALVVDPAATLLPEPLDVEAAERAALATEGQVVLVRLAGTTGSGIHLFRGTDVARRIAMQTLVGRGVVTSDVQLTLPPVQVITKAKEAGALVQSLQNTIERLRFPLHYNDEPAIPMMVLRQLAQMVSRAEQTQLRGEAAEVLAAKDRLVAEAKILLLLNVLYYEDRNFLNRYYHYLDNPSPILFFEHLADILVYESRQNHQALQRQTQADYEKVLAAEGLLHAYQILLSYAKRFFPDSPGIFNRRLFDIGFKNGAALTRHIEAQVQQAKKALQELRATRS